MARSDEYLLQMALEGDGASFGVLAQRWERRIHGFIFRYVGNSEEARDLRRKCLLVNGRPPPAHGCFLGQQGDVGSLPDGKHDDIGRDQVIAAQDDIEVRSPVDKTTEVYLGALHARHLASRRCDLSECA